MAAILKPKPWVVIGVCRPIGAARRIDLTAPKREHRKKK
jgi:hypothetical protein